MKLDILAIGAHPDDVEMSCGATIAKEKAAGKEVGIIDLTRGELGTRGTPELREKEAKAAAAILGVQVRENLEMEDGFIRNDKESKLTLIKRIRLYRPDIVLCNAVDDRHIDHGVASKLVSDACFLSGLRKITTEVGGQSQQAWRPGLVLHYIQWKDLEPDIVIDVSGFMDQKLEAVFAYKSQFYDENSKEPVTPIATKNATESLRYRNRNFGRLIGTEYGEGFNTERYPAVNSLFDLI